MQAFIVRPFFTKEGVDFEKIHKELIKAALEEAEIAGDTTASVFEAGNIREDMFQRLLLADLVVADISIPNPNVYYELGIRHALRSRQTCMIRAKVTKPREQRTSADEVPFDLKTDRYLEYDSANPAASIPDLVRLLKHTKVSDRTDSPVFRSLPRLDEPDHAKLSPVPLGFANDVESAAVKTQCGKLGLLGRESSRFLWELGGRRLVGRSQFQCKCMSAARESWERIRGVYPLDLEANLTLGTIYQRLGDLSAADQSLQSVLANPFAIPDQRAEALALKGRNAKVRGRRLWEGKDENDVRVSTLRSGLLDAQRLYAEAFNQDLNHFYSGLNALSLAELLLGIIDLEPNAWDAVHDSEDDASKRRQELLDDRDRLAIVVGLSLRAAEQRTAQTDIWLLISQADYRFLTGKKDAASAAAYERVLGLAEQFHISSARDQLELFQRAGVLAERVRLCLNVFPPKPPSFEPLRHAIVFTGHMIDAPERVEPRFPSAKETIAREAIRRQLLSLITALPGPALGIAGGANGGDILFHEVCAELHIPTRVLLALPEGPFIAESVEHGGAGWILRFGALMKNHSDKNEVQVLGPDKKLPDWMREPENYDIWQRANLWLLEEAFASEARNLSLMALWDGKTGDGPGGTKDLIDTARARGVNTVLLNTTVIFSETQ
jgi:hypothetical protein